MKIKQTISLMAMAMLLGSIPAMADQPAITDVSQELTITVPGFLKVSKTESGNVTSQALSVTDGTHASIASALTQTFLIETNYPGAVLYLKALCGGGISGATAVSALKTTSDTEGKIVFVNEAQVTSATLSGVVDGCTGSPTIGTSGNNKGAIAFTYGLTTDTTTLQSAMPTSGDTAFAMAAQGTVSHKMTLQPGQIKVIFATTGSEAPIASTFDMNDAAGDYKATLIVTDVNPAP